MKVTVLGSGAAEAWPGLYCECEACTEARRRGGPNLRRRTAYLLNGDTLVDYGPDISWQVNSVGAAFRDIRHLLVTHSHEDHFTPVELYWRYQGFCQVSQPLAVYANRNVFARLEAAAGPNHAPHDIYERLLLERNELTPGDQAKAGPLKVTALEANHAGPDEQALNYLIEQSGKTLLIGNDTGFWPDQTWDLVRQFRIDLAFIDCTCGHKHPNSINHHLGVESMTAMRDKLRELGVLNDGARVFANHFSHNGLTLHEELCEYFAPLGIEVAYDGLVVEIQAPPERGTRTSPPLRRG